MPMRGTYIGNNRMLISPLWGGKLIVPSDDLSITPDLVLSGVLELSLTNFIRATVKPGMTVLDIGAHVGYFSVLMGMIIGPTGKLYAYEANPRTYDFLYDNLSINYLHDRAEIHLKAVHSVEAAIPFYACSRFTGNSSIHRHSEEYHRNYHEAIDTINMYTVVLNKQFPDQHIDFIKMDIEGGELNAFLGMNNLIVEERVDTVAFELNKEMLGDDYQGFIDLLRHYEAQGLWFFTLTAEGGLNKVTVDDLVGMGSVGNVVMMR